MQPATHHGNKTPPSRTEDTDEVSPLLGAPNGAGTAVASRGPALTPRDRHFPLTLEGSLAAGALVR